MGPDAAAWPQVALLDGDAAAEGIDAEREDFAAVVDQMNQGGVNGAAGVELRDRDTFGESSLALDGYVAQADSGGHHDAHAGGSGFRAEGGRGGEWGWNRNGISRGC